MFEFIVTAMGQSLPFSPMFMLNFPRSARCAENCLIKQANKAKARKQTLHVWACYTPKISNLIKQIYEEIFYSFSWKHGKFSPHFHLHRSARHIRGKSEIIIIRQNVTFKDFWRCGRARGGLSKQKKIIITLELCLSCSRVCVWAFVAC